MGSKGTEAMKWTAPVRPGDTLHVVVEVLNRRESSRGDRGYIGFLWHALNQRGETVIEMRSTQIIATRPKD
jgi:acyl dehydratase